MSRRKRYSMQSELDLQVIELNFKWSMDFHLPTTMDTAIYSIKRYVEPAIKEQYNRTSPFWDALQRKETQ